MLVDFAPYLFRGRLAGFPDAPERDRPRQRHLRRRPGAGVRRQSTEVEVSIRGRVDAVMLDRRSDARSVAAISSPGRAQRRRSLPRHQAGRARGAHRRRGERRRWRRASRPRSTQSARRWQGVLIEQVATRPLTAAPPEVLDALERADAGILCVQPQQGELAARMAIVAGRRAPRHPLRAHGRRHAADHAAGHARRLPAGRRAQPEPVRADAARASACASRRRAAPRSPRRSIRRFTGSRPAG